MLSIKDESRGNNRVKLIWEKDNELYKIIISCNRFIP